MIDIKDSKGFLAFLNDAYDDYIAARILFGSQLLKQGAILSSTCLEKLFKALISLKGPYPHGHLRKAHWNQFKNYNRKLYNRLNEDFLRLNQKCYQLRYTESLDEGFNLVIARNEYLAELDYTFLTIYRSFKIESNVNKVKLRYDHAVETKDFNLFADNHMLQDIDKEKYSYEKQRIYEIRVTKGGNIVLEYNTESSPTEKSFLREGCIHDESNNTITTQFAQIMP